MVGKAAADERPDQRADAEKHPMLRPDAKASAEPARDEVDKENHVRHEPDRVQPILDIEC